jgi:AAA15 family ATPase/GTPase
MIRWINKIFVYLGPFIMIQKVTIRNFKCILKATLEMTYSEGKAPNGWKTQPLHPFIENGKNRDGRICPVLALYGANASGKTSMLEAIVILRQVILNGAVEGHPWYKPNRIVSGKDREPTVFSIEFWKDNSKFCYSLTYNIDRIENESLTCDGVPVFTTANGLLLSDLGDMAQTTFSAACVNAKTQLQVKTFLNEACRSLPGLSKDLLSAEEFLIKDIVPLKGNGIPFPDGIKLLADTFEGDEKTQRKLALEEIAKWLQKLDFHVTGLALDDSKKVSDFLSTMPPEMANFVTQTGMSNQTLFSMTTVHKKDSGDNVFFTLGDESEGTKRLVGLLGLILTCIKKGKVILIDEIDQSLHSLILIELIRLFKEKRINTNKAQLICTLHNTDLLCSDLLSLSEVGIVSQGRFDGSRILRLSSINGLRNANDFRARYLRGDFGGIPFPYV